MISASAQNSVLDELIFGDPASEQKHALSEKATKAIKGGLDEPARMLLPIESERVEGGNVSFKIQVDPQKQNYITVRFWGSDAGDDNILILFIEGDQIGYRHLGDYDMLYLANKEKPFLGRFHYTTMPLPVKYTKGKTEVNISIRSTGGYNRYSPTFEQYQKKMKEPAKAIYKAYSHTNGYLDIAKEEKQGTLPASTGIRKTPGEEVLKEVKTLLNKEIDKMMNKAVPTQDEIHLLAEAYYIKWTNVYNDKKVIRKTIELADLYAKRYEVEGAKLYEDSWVTTGPLCMTIRYFIDDIKPELDKDPARKAKWATLFKACVDYAKTHRRGYTNQGMIVDWCLYEVNNTLSMIAPELALPKAQTLNYLYEAVGLKPWLGSETPNGPDKRYGNNYYQLTDKGLTKELGFVGGYGEIGYWAMYIYNATAERGKPNSGDTKLREQLLKMTKARTYFRNISTDEDGYKTMRAEAVIGWRDPYPYPGYIMYGEKGSTRETTPLMVTATTLDPELIGYAQQMLADHQFFNVIKDKMNDKGTTSLKTLLRVPDEYELIIKQPKQNHQLPMTPGQPDFVFTDEENGVVAFKNGEETFYTSLYWRSNYAVNFLARVHYTTPTVDHIATVFEDVQYTPSGMTYKRPQRINLAFSNARDFYPGIKSAHTGEELPIAKIPDGISFKPGDENVHAGKGDFYTLQYGKYLITLNTTTDKNFTLQVPAGYKKVTALTDNRKTVTQKQIQVKPRTTVVLILEN
jgi:hypothetical protein